MAYDPKYDKLLRAIERGKQSDVITLFERRQHDVNEAIHYLFEDGKRFTVTPLYWAVRHNCPKVCKYLLSKGARPYGAMVYEYYPLHEACNRGYDEVVQEFVNARCEVDKVNRDADTPLHVACMRGHIQSVHVLLRAGSDCNLRNKLGHTPLQCAVYHDRNDLVELFKAHNKGIETTPPLRNLASSTVATTLTATGVRVQRSHSFNAADTSSGDFDGGHSRRREGSGIHGRVRNSSSSSRPLSYYENGGNNNSALVIGQPPLSAFSQAHSQSMQSLSEGSSSYLSSFSTISTHLPINYTIPSPDSPVELDAPIRCSVDPPRTTGTSKKPAEPTVSCLRSYPIPTEDFGTKHGNTTQTGEGLSKFVKDGESSEYFTLPCPFPSPSGGKQKEDKKLAPHKKHPLSSSTRSGHHHHHGDKPLHEQMSHPEFHITRRDVQITNRAKSTNDVLFSSTNSTRSGNVSEQCTAHISLTREHINSLTSTLCDTLELNVPTTSHHTHTSLPHTVSSSTTSSPPSSQLHSLLQSLRNSLGSQAHRFGLSPDHVKCLTELAVSSSLHPTPPTLPSSTLSSLSSMQSIQEIDFEVIEGPIDAQIWREDNGRGEAFATLLYKVQVCDALIQLRSHMNQGDIAFLKVRVRLEMQGGNSISPSIGQLNDTITEAALLQTLPSHPNIITVLYSCRGHTEKFKKDIMHRIQSGFHTTTSQLSQSHSGITECLHGSQNNPQIYTLATTGSFLFQTVPGISLAKYFHEFLRSDQKESTIEETFLHILAQLLLAVAHLRHNLVSHCAISSDNVYISDRGQRVVLGEFGDAINLRPNNLDVLQKSLKRLKASSKTRKLSPEAEEHLASIDPEVSATTIQTATPPTLEESFSLSDSYAVGAMFYELLGGRRKTPESDTPFIHCLSFRCNHLLQKLVARNPLDRFSALQGAISCFVLLFGPRTSEIASSSECIRWLVSESLELYLNPILRDSKLPSNRDSNHTRRLHYTYLVSANPDLVYNSCKFFNND